MRRYYDEDVFTQQTDIMHSKATTKIKWLPLYGSVDEPERTPQGFVNTVPCMRVTVPLLIKHKPTSRQYLRAVWLALIDWTIDHINAIVICAFLLALLAAVV